MDRVSVVTGARREQVCPGCGHEGHVGWCDAALDEDGALRCQCLDDRTLEEQATNDAFESWLAEGERRGWVSRVHPADERMIGEDRLSRWCSAHDEDSFCCADHPEVVRVSGSPR